jgi:hypothetical protein
MYVDFYFLSCKTQSIETERALLVRYLALRPPRPPKVVHLLLNSLNLRQHTSAHASSFSQMEHPEKKTGFFFPISKLL